MSKVHARSHEINKPLGQVKKVSRPDFYKKESGRAVFFFGICYFLLHAFFTHYYLPPGIRWSS